MIEKTGWSSSHVLKLVATGETNLVELKQKWYDLTKREETGKFIRSILALANTATASEPGALIIGVADQRSGGEIIGADSGPSDEAIAQIMSRYTMPAIRSTAGPTTPGSHVGELFAVAVREGHQRHLATARPLNHGGLHRWDTEQEVPLYFERGNPTLKGLALKPARGHVQYFGRWSKFKKFL